MRKGLAFGGRCLIADEMGLGKTVQVRCTPPVRPRWLYCVGPCYTAGCALPAAHHICRHDLLISGEQGYIVYLRTATMQ